MPETAAFPSVETETRGSPAFGCRGMRPTTVAAAGGAVKLCAICGQQPLGTRGPGAFRFGANGVLSADFAAPCCASGGF